MQRPESHLAAHTLSTTTQGTCSHASHLAHAVHPCKARAVDHAKTRAPIRCNRGAAPPAKHRHAPRDDSHNKRRMHTTGRPRLAQLRRLLPLRSLFIRPSCRKRRSDSFVATRLSPLGLLALPLPSHATSLPTLPPRLCNCAELPPPRCRHRLSTLLSRRSLAAVAVSAAGLPLTLTLTPHCGHRTRVVRLREPRSPPARAARCCGMQCA